MQLEQVIKMLQDAYGVFYIRMLRKNAVGIYEEGSTFTLGKAPVLRDGTDVCIAASGIMVSEALKAAKVLEEQGISPLSSTASPGSLWTMTPSAIMPRNAALLSPPKTTMWWGGLGSAVAASLSKSHPVPVEMVGVQDEFGEVGTVDYLQERFGLTAAAIVSAAQKAISRK